MTATALVSAATGWSGRRQWAVLGVGAHASDFLACWHDWQLDAARPDRLHFVALATTRDAFMADSPKVESSGTAPLHAALLVQSEGWLPGFHRLSFEKGCVSLTLCLGELRSSLRELEFAADAMRWYSYNTPDDDALRALARLSRVGTRLEFPALSADERTRPVERLLAQGFEPEPPGTASQATVAAVFRPRWTRSRQRHVDGWATAPGTCVVIGAGLAGACSAASLARRGWQVQVLDQGEQPAAGASGLPAGLVVPHVSPDDSMLSRLSRCGVRLTLRHAADWLRSGDDWQQTGVLEHSVDGPAGWPADWLGNSQALSQPASAEQIAAAGLPADASARWHAQAGWIKPVRLIEAMLSQPGISFSGRRHIHQLRYSASGWELLDEQMRCIARADLVVLAAGPASQALSGGQVRLQPVRGQVSWATQQEVSQYAPAWPPFPINGSGNLVPSSPGPHGLEWHLGSSFVRDSESLEPSVSEHAANLGRLQRLSPALAQSLRGAFEQGQVHAFTAIRCASRDRMPVVGPVRTAEGSGLWICSGMGSRGLSFSVLCGELLAARLHGEPLPVEQRLAKALDVARLARAG